MLSGNSAGYSQYSVGGFEKLQEPRQATGRTSLHACKLLSQSWSHSVIEAGNYPVHVTSPRL